MIIRKRHLAAAIFCLSFPLRLLAEAPVVDDGERFAMVDTQQADLSMPVAKAQLDDTDNTNAEDAFVVDNSNKSSETGTSDNAKFLETIQSLQQQVQELRGQLEVQAHDLKMLQQQQVAFYKDLDARLRDPNVSLAAKPPAQAKMSIDTAQDVAYEKLDSKPQQPISVQNKPNRTNPADEQISYLAAYDLVKSKRYDDAIVAMEHFAAQYPQGGYTANAQYWLGELYLVKNDYSKAIAHFNTVLQQFPSSSKSAPSMLKIGYALADSGKIEAAKSQLRQVVKNYPDTSTAQLATTKLETLGSL